ncbi:DUF1702 family protein [Bradyrhizobium sp. HKCCYLS1011]|uniref:DUF1702 family protein n=1 Tax=Bradyrhizobium sp. HKCCYLS1011 TaxID=3420733 RepID=UPI003EBF5644
MSATTDDERMSAGMNFLTHPVRRILKLSLADALFETRGFMSSNVASQSKLERIGRVFIGGFNASLAAGDLVAVLRYIDGIPLAERGFAVEGATMAAAVVDALPFSRSMLPQCIAAFNSDFTYLAHVGAGWALARVPWQRKRILAALDPIHGWLAVDGLGFHDTYFYHRNIVAGWRRKQSGYAIHVYDQGVGRALWFVSGGSVGGAIRLISTFAVERQHDLWSGLGLAMAYAGPVADVDALDALKAAGNDAGHFAQGVAFACEARVLARHVPEHTDQVAREVWNETPYELATLVRDSRHGLPNVETDPPRYQSWRDRVAHAFVHSARRIQ